MELLYIALYPQYYIHISIIYIIYLYLYIDISLNIYLSICLSIYLSIYIYIYISLSLSIYIYIRILLVYIDKLTILRYHLDRSNVAQNTAKYVKISIKLKTLFLQLRKRHKVNVKLNCGNKSLLYLLTCEKCCKQYVD